MCDRVRLATNIPKLNNESSRCIVPMGAPTYTIWHRPYPLFIDRARGSRLYDVEGFQKELRELTAKYDVLLIFDKIATCFKVALGGAQQVLGITPDLTCLGKTAGGGLPIGAVGGREDVMSVVVALDPRAEHFGPLFPTEKPGCFRDSFQHLQIGPNYYD